MFPVCRLRNDLSRAWYATDRFSASGARPKDVAQSVDWQRRMPTTARWRQCQGQRLTDGGRLC